MTESHKKELITGVNQIITLCTECLLELNKQDMNENRVSDILAEEIPEKSEYLFDRIYEWFGESNTYIDNSH